MCATFWYSYTFHWKAISSRCSILSCERLSIVFIPFCIFLYAIFICRYTSVPMMDCPYNFYTQQCPNSSLNAISSQQCSSKPAIGSQYLLDDLSCTVFWFHSLLVFIVCWYHVATPFSQLWIVRKPLRNIAVSKVFFESNELIAPFLETCVWLGWVVLGCFFSFTF